MHATHVHIEAMDACDEIAGRLAVAVAILQSCYQDARPSVAEWGPLVVQEIVAECMDLAARSGAKAADDADDAERARVQTSAQGGA